AAAPASRAVQGSAPRARLFRAAPRPAALRLTWIPSLGPYIRFQPSASSHQLPAISFQLPALQAICRERLTELLSRWRGHIITRHALSGLSLAHVSADALRVGGCLPKAGRGGLACGGAASRTAGGTDTGARTSEDCRAWRQSHCRTRAARDAGVSIRPSGSPRQSR